jgi:hypothetical protein
MTGRGGPATPRFGLARVVDAGIVGFRNSSAP